MTTDINRANWATELSTCSSLHVDFVTPNKAGSLLQNRFSQDPRSRLSGKAASDSRRIPLDSLFVEIASITVHANQDW